MSTGESRPRRRDAVAGPPAVGSASSASEITLRDMRFHVRVGILPHEREIPQPLAVDLTVWPRARTGLLDYRALYEAVRRSLDGPVAYLEDAGQAIAGRVLADERVDRVRVALRKPHVALPGPLAYAEVVVERAREGGQGQA